jgi:hypothetical protein
MKRPASRAKPPNHGATVAVVIGDIVNSSLYAARERQQIQQRLNNAWNIASHETSTRRSREFGFRVTGGDEFEVVCESLPVALDLLTSLRLQVRALPVKPYVSIRACVAADELYVRDRGGDPYGSDGPVFHRARAGMECLKEQPERLSLLTWPSPSEPFVHLANEILPLLDVIYRYWTPKQAEVILLARQGLSGGEIATALKITSSAVSQRLRGTSWEEYFRMVTIIKRMISGDIKVIGLNSQN